MPLLAVVFTCSLGLAAPALAQDEIVVLAPDANRSVATETAQREQRLGFTAEHEYDRVIDGFAADLTAAQVAALKADPEVAMVVPNRRVSASAIVSAADPTKVGPGIRRVTRTAPETVRESADGAVAVLDTGVDLQHPDLNVAAGANCVKHAAAPDDVNGHGTHVAGVIGARNNTTGSTGVAPGTKIYAVKVLDDRGNGSTATILCGAEWVLANAGTDFGASATYETPAAYPQVLTVTAMNDTDGQPGGSGASDTCTRTPDERYASFSNFTTRAADEAHLVAAPGVCIRSAAPGGGATDMSGTSMAAPHVAGLVALCKGEGGVAGPCAGLTTPQVIARMRVQSAWSSFTGVSGRLFGPVATLSDPATPTPAPAQVVEAPAPAPPAETTTTTTPVPAEQPELTLDPAPAPAPAVVPPATQTVSSRPSLVLVTPRLATLRRRGLTARLGCADACAGMIRLRVSKATARRVHLKSTILATAWPDAPGAVTLRLGRTARARLAKVRSAFKVELVAEIELGSRTVRSAKTLTIRR